VFREREQLSNHEHHHENECCAHEAAPTEIALNASAAGNLQTTLQVAGVDCAEEVSLIQRALKPLEGVREVRVNIMSGKAVIAHDETITSDVLIKVIGDVGLKAIREGEKVGDEAQKRQKQRLLSVSISGVFTLLGLLVHWAHFAPESVTVALFLAAIISGGWFIAPKAVAAARRLTPDMNLLMTVAVLGAAGIGAWSEGAAVAFLFALSELLESFSVARARRAIQSLLKLAPQTAMLKDGDRFAEVPVEEVRIGDIVAVKSGARVPLDGAVVNGNSSVDQAPITGESMPVEKKQGDQVFAGTINGEGSLEVRVTKNYSDTTLSKIIHLVEEEHEMPVHHLLERILDEYIVVAGLQSGQPLFQSVNSAGTEVTGRALNRYNAWAAIRKRAKAAGFLTPVGCHTWRATGITIYLENDGRLEHAQQMAGHESPRTTKLYDRTKDEITLSEVERIRL
jgi:Zn2+/Cd2+-exporting ATPase